MAWVEVRDESPAALAATDEAQATAGWRSAPTVTGPGSRTSSTVCTTLTEPARRCSPLHRTSQPRTEGVGHCTKSTSSGCSPSASHYCGPVSHPSQISWLARTAMQHALCVEA
jgi:hypothetical protein